MKTILIVDDDPTFRMLCREYLKKEYNTIEVECTKDAEMFVGDPIFDCMILDYRMPGEDGFQFIHRIYEYYQRRTEHMPPIIFVSALFEHYVPEASMDLGARAVLDKTQFSQEELIATIKRLTGEVA